MDQLELIVKTMDIVDGVISTKNHLASSARISQALAAGFNTDPEAMKNFSKSLKDDDQGDCSGDCCRINVSTKLPPITYCPLHRAAPDLLELCKSLVSNVGYLLIDARISPTTKAIIESTKETAKELIQKLEAR